MPNGSWPQSLRVEDGVRIAFINFMRLWICVNLALDLFLIFRLIQIKTFQIITSLAAADLTRKQSRKLLIHLINEDCKLFESEDLFARSLRVLWLVYRSLTNCKIKIKRLMTFILGVVIWLRVVFKLSFVKSSWLIFWKFWSIIC